MSQQVCTLPMITKKGYAYEERYFGGKDQDDLRHGQGIYHWTGPKSIEWYEGNFCKNTLNGYGDYRWRYQGVKGTFTTYEGYFYVNDMHGYGTMSYPDGRTFTGLFRKNSRYGPGIQKHVNTEADVGIWYGNQLIRITWQPIAPYSLVPDFTTVPYGKVYVDMFRKVLAVILQPKDSQKMNAIDLLKQSGADPVWASNNWKKLFSKHMSDTQSAACYVDALNKNFNKGDLRVLEEIHFSNTEIEISSVSTADENVIDKLFYAWNDNPTMIDIMKLCFAHDKMRDSSVINLEGILNGPRVIFSKPGPHEKCCRMLLMACFVGAIENVVRLVNESGVHPDLADIRGNSALMYATCGDQLDIMHFLVEAGANVNGYNDTCCTPLCVALMRVACARRDIGINGLFDAVIPPGSDDIDESGGRVVEWEIDRHIHKVYFDLKDIEEIVKPVDSTVIKSLQDIKPRSILLKKSQSLLEKSSKKSLDAIKENESDFAVDGGFCSYNSLKTDYLLGVIDQFVKKSESCYLFEVDNMYLDVLAVVNREDSSQNPQKKKDMDNVESKKAIEKLKKSYYWLQPKVNEEMVTRLMPTVNQLLNDGADPHLIHCPYPALHIALASGSPDILRLLLEHGANVNQIIYQPFNYTALDIVVSRPFIQENRDMIKTLLEHGADVNNRIWVLDELGPTLLHVIIMREPTDFREMEIRDDILVLFAKHNYNPLIRYRGRSIIEIMLCENLFVMLKNFNAHAKFDRNAPINYLQQNILVKMFTKKYFLRNIRQLEFKDCKDLIQQIIQSGADALSPCQNNEEKYTNLFQFVKKEISEWNPFQPEKCSDNISKNSLKSKRSTLTTSTRVLNSRSKKSGIAIEAENKELQDYKKALEVIIEDTRENYVIWIQAKLLKNLVPIIHKYKYRSWHMIMKNHNEHKAVGFWLSQQRCLDIWNLLKNANKKLYQDPNVLKYFLFIVMFYNMKREIMVTLDGQVKGLITSAEKRTIELDTLKFLSDFKNSTMSKASLIESTPLPVFMPKTVKRFNVCFECFSTLEESKMLCSVCEMVSFCGDQCFEKHIRRETIHPCRPFLRDKENINNVMSSSVVPSSNRILIE